MYTWNERIKEPPETTPGIFMPTGQHDMEHIKAVSVFEGALDVQQILHGFVLNIFFTHN